MEIVCKGVSRIKHKDSGEEFEISSDDLEWEVLDGDEGPMGPRTHFQASLNHEHLGRISWSIWEYPTGATNMAKTDVGGHVLMEDFEYGLQHTPDDISDLHLNVDFDRELTDAEISGLSIPEQVSYLVWWFGQYYWDPAHETPYNGREGGYLYVFGGPYNANDELRQEFEGVVAEKAIEQAVDEIEQDGTFDWAPSPKHPDQVSAREDYYQEAQQSPSNDLKNIQDRLNPGFVPKFGHEEELNERQNLRAGISELRALLKDLTPSHGGIGHNNPPDDMALDRIAIDKLSITINMLHAKTDDPNPDIQETIETVGKLESFLNWGARKLSLSLDEFMKQLGKRGADLAVISIGITGMGGWEQIWSKIAEIYQSAVSWLNAITSLL